MQKIPKIQKVKIKISKFYIYLLFDFIQKIFILGLKYVTFQNYANVLIISDKMNQIRLTKFKNSYFLLAF